jgi:hypothetical protein
MRIISPLITEQLRAFVQDFLHAQRFLFLLLDLDQEANSGTIFFFNHGFYFNDFKNTSILPGRHNIKTFKSGLFFAA